MSLGLVYAGYQLLLLGACIGIVVYGILRPRA